MMRSTRLFFTALLGCTAISASATDHRIRTLRYDSNEIVTVPGRSNIQSTIEFNSDEHIESIAVGNSGAWQVTPNHRASLLFVKPLVRLSRTNMTVITDKRTYMFDLVTGRREAAPIYSLRFTYPAEQVQAAKLAVAPIPPPPTPAPASPVELNFAWKTKGAVEVLPGRIFNDGQSLYLSWSHDALLPAISTVANDGREASLNYRLSGDYIVITPVPDNVMLRYGKKTAEAFRTAPTKTLSAPTSQVAIRAPAEIAVPHPIVATPAALAPAQPQQAPAGSGQMVASDPPAGGQARLLQKLAYPGLNDDHLTDSNHE